VSRRTLSVLLCKQGVVGSNPIVSTENRWCQGPAVRPRRRARCPSCHPRATSVSRPRCESPVHAGHRGSGRWATSGRPSGHPSETVRATVFGTIPEARGVHVCVVPRRGSCTQSRNVGALLLQSGPLAVGRHAPSWPGSGRPVRTGRHRRPPTRWPPPRSPPDDPAGGGRGWSTPKPPHRSGDRAENHSQF